MPSLVCPRCDQPLSPQPSGLRCAACQVEFPMLGQVPFLWAEPAASLLDWRNRFNRDLAEVEADLAQVQQTPAALPASKQRLSVLAGGLQSYLQELAQWLDPLKIGETLARETHLALRTRLPSHHAVLSYTQNIFRDWCWGDEENHGVFNIIRRTLDNHAQPQQILVLGGGAGRLAYDLQRHYRSDQTWMLDSNPLLCLIAHAMFNGEQRQLTEFPLAPLKAEDAAVSQTLCAPDGAVSELNVVCADALRPPFAAASFDLIITPWLLDVIDASLTETVGVVGHLLKPNGLWLNHGSVAFQGRPVQQIVADELAAISEQLGFTMIENRNDTLPYLHSPGSRQKRHEVVYTQLAQRQEASIERRPRHQHQPDWLVAGNQPVPLSPAFQQQITVTRIHAFMMSLIDGQRSIKDMANILEEQRLMPTAEAEQAIKQFLRTMHEQSAQQ